MVKGTSLIDRFRYSISPQSAWRTLSAATFGVCLLSFGLVVSAHCAGLVVSPDDGAAAELPSIQPSDEDVEQQAKEMMRVLQCQLEQAQGDATGDAEKCLKAAGIEPETAEDWNNQGWSRLQQGRTDEAIGDFSEALKREPTYDKARINKANALADKGDMNAALNEIALILERDPSDFAGLENRCTLLDRADRAEEGLTACSKAVDMYPAEYGAHNNRGWVNWGLGRFSEAVRDFAKATEIDPDDATALLNLLSVFPWLTSKDELLPLLERLPAMGPAHQDAFVSLFSMFVQSGDVPESTYQLGLDMQKARPTDARLSLALALAAVKRHDAVMTSQQVKALLAPLDASERAALSPMTSNNAAKVRKFDPAKKLDTYLSDSDRGACYMESRQRAEFQSFWDADKLERFKNGPFGDPTPLISAKDLPTRYENPAGFMILEALTKEIESAIRRFGTDNDKDIPPLLFGTLDSTNVNAEAIVVPPGWTCDNPAATASKFDDRIILVNVRTFDFAYMMTKLLTRTVAFSAVDPSATAIDTSDRATYRLLRDHPDLADNYEALVNAFLMIAPTRPEIPINMQIADIIEQATHAAELFVVSHEYGHVLLGHDLGDGESSGSAAVRLNTWRQELEADVFATRTLVAIAQGDGTDGAMPTDQQALYLMAPVLFLREMELMEDADNLINGRQTELTDDKKARLLGYVSQNLGDAGAATPSDTQMEGQILQSDHPPLWLRRALLQTIVMELMENPQGQAERYNDMTGLFLTLMDHVDLLFEVSKPGFANAPALAAVQAEIDRQVQFSK